MPSHDAMHAPDPVPADRRMSRRTLLRGTAAAGVAGLAVAAVGGPASAAPSRPGAPDQPDQPDQRNDPAQATPPLEPIVVHVRDAKSGDIEVFHGTSQTRLRDQDLAARIARAIA
jgi:hypothetical protein